MSTVFDKELVGYRFVLTRYGDTLQRVALRELGDASKWTTLVALNKLQPPYLTDDPTAVTDYVVLNGTTHLVLPATSAASAQPDPAAVFGTDLLLTADGFLSITSADFDTVSGVENLSQALRNALATDQGELLFHPTYGTLIRRILGKVAGPTAQQLAAEYAKSTVAADARIKQVDSATATTVGTAITVTVQAETVIGEPVSASATS
jgi:phage baseplate assembly protein W